MAHAAHGIGTATAIRPVQHILFPVAFGGMPKTTRGMQCLDQDVLYLAWMRAGCQD